MVRLYLANDTSSRAAGAERLADAWCERPEIQLIRTSSRGAFFLEPMVERDTPNGREAYLPPGEAVSKEYPFVLTTGRILQHYNCGAQTRRTDILELVDTDVLEMHPDDIEGLHLCDGEVVRLVSDRGEALLPVVGSERVLRGHLFTSFHFPASTVNALLSSSADDSSKCPEYKVSAVRVESIEREELDLEDEAELRHMRRQLIL